MGWQPASTACLQHLDVADPLLRGVARVHRAALLDDWAEAFAFPAPAEYERLERAWRAGVARN